MGWEPTRHVQLPARNTYTSHGRISNRRAKVYTVVKWPVNQDHGNSHGCSSRHQKNIKKRLQIGSYLMVSTDMYGLYSLVLNPVRKRERERESEKHWKNMKKIFLDPFTPTISWCCSCWNLFLLHHDLSLDVLTIVAWKSYTSHPAAVSLSDFLPTPMAKGPNFPKTPSVGPWFAMAKRPCPTHSFATIHFAPWFRRSSASATIHLTNRRFGMVGILKTRNDGNLKYYEFPKTHKISPT